MSKKLPHIILFNPDQWRGDVIGHHGNPAAVTPHLDEMVLTDSVSFSHAYCQNPVCTPSRCSFMSGWYPHVRGHRTMFHMMNKDEPVLLKTLKEHGYWVWWGGKNDLIPAENGYDDYCNVKYTPDKPVRTESNLHKYDTWRGSPGSDTYYSFMAGKLPENSDEQVYYDGDWANVYGAIEQIKNHSSDQPLCIYLPLLYPHPPYGVEEPWFSMIHRSSIPERIPYSDDMSGKPSLLKGIYEKQGMQTWSEERWTELRAVYYGMCARVDHQFMLVMNALKEADMYDDTAVFFFSDHGDFTGDYGLVEKTQNTFEEVLTRVPFVIKPPKDTKVKPGVRHALVELIDLSATIEAITGIEPKHTHFGRSLLPLISGETDQHRDAVFCEGGRLFGEEQSMEQPSFAQGPTSHYYPRVSLQNQEGPEHTKAIMVRTAEYKYVKRLYEQDELYDMNLDPAEQVNRINDPSYQEVVRSLRERLLTFYLETSDVVPHELHQRE